MAALENHNQSQVGKILLFGESGMGKTGALVSLAMT